MSNALFIIHPYRTGNIWAFDDPERGLIREPFVAGIPEMIKAAASTGLLKPRAKSFDLTFSARSFPGHQVMLQWTRKDGTGNWYRWAALDMEGWLCPALLCYFPSPPKKIYLQLS